MRSKVTTIPLNIARSFGRLLGTELVVEVSEHSISTKMQTKNTDNRAWDPNLYKHGQMYHEGYANPIKPRVRTNKELEKPDTIDVEESGDPDSDMETPGKESEDRHVELISSPRYRKYMRQDLISQLLTPKEQWKLIAYGVLGLAILQFMAIIVTFYATGSF